MHNSCGRGVQRKRRRTESMGKYDTTPHSGGKIARN